MMPITGVRGFRMNLGSVDVLRSAGGGTTPFAPTDIAGLSAWYDASDAASFTYSSGVVVSQWNDKSGNSRHIVNGTVAQQPSRSVTIGSLDAVDFDGSADFLTTSSTHQVVGSGNGSWSAFVVMKSDAVSGDTVIVGAAKASDFAPQMISYTSSGPVRTVASNIATYTIDSGPTLDTNPHVAAAIQTGSTSIECWLDGTSAGSTAISGGTVHTGVTYVSLGALYGGAALSYFNGRIGEALIYNSALNSTNRQAVEAYLKAKWGTP